MRAGSPCPRGRSVNFRNGRWTSTSEATSICSLEEGAAGVARLSIRSLCPGSVEKVQRHQSSDEQGWKAQETESHHIGAGEGPREAEQVGQDHHHRPGNCGE